MTMKVNPGVYPSREAIDFVDQSFDSFKHGHLRFLLFLIYIYMFSFPLAFLLICSETRRCFRGAM